jgi:hypothetical protein
MELCNGEQVGLASGLRADLDFVTYLMKGHGKTFGSWLFARRAYPPRSYQAPTPWSSPSTNAIHHTHDRVGCVRGCRVCLCVVSCAGGVRSTRIRRCVRSWRVERRWRSTTCSCTGRPRRPTRPRTTSSPPSPTNCARLSPRPSSSPSPFSVRPTRHDTARTHNSHY